MRRAAIFSADLIASIMIVAWYVWGPWIDLYGFSVYHSRGDVWLPTPPGARNFLTAMVSIEAGLFASLFVAASCLLFRFGRFPNAGDAEVENFLPDAFYGDWRRLLAKYSALFLSSIALPFAIITLWKLHATRAFAKPICLAITLATFLVVALVTNRALLRAVSRQKLT
jgi:hypothetical protein